MEKLMRWLGAALRAMAATPAPGGQKGGAPTATLRATAIGVFYACAIGSLDLVTPKRMVFDLFYLLGCAFVGWAAGGRPALFVTLTSGLFLFWDGDSSKSGPSPGWIFTWNLVIRMLGFGTVGFLAAEIGRLTRGLEQTVQQRTASLASAVDEHKSTSARLRETLELFRQVTENITEVFWVTDPAKTRVNYVSRGFERVWGQPRQAVYTSPEIWWSGIYAKDRSRVREATHRKQMTGDYDEEYRVQRPDGSICWVHDRAFPVRNEKAEVYRIVGITEDVTERKLAEQLLEAQRDVGMALSVSSDLNAALERLLQTVAGLEGMDCGAVYLVHPESGDLNLEAHLGLSPGFVVQAARFAADSAEARLVTEGRALYPVCAPDWNTEGSFWSGAGLRSLAVLPMRHEGKVLGILNLGSHLQDEVPTQMRVALETVAAQAAGAIARIRLEKQILEISDREQARIGQDIHDGLCQQLIGMALIANSLEHSLASAERPEAAVARKLRGLLDESITESRRVCRGLYPVRLQTEGLVPALQEMARTVSERHPIQCHCEPDAGRLQCDVTVATHLYRIAQEAVNNAIKHSGGANIWMRLEASESGLVLEVWDDGRGIRDSTAPSGGMGLHIMDYRARTVGGTVRIMGGQGGTHILCQVPWRGGPIREPVSPRPKAEQLGEDGSSGQAQTAPFPREQGSRVGG